MIKFTISHVPGKHDTWHDEPTSHVVQSLHLSCVPVRNREMKRMKEKQDGDTFKHSIGNFFTLVKQQEERNGEELLQLVQECTTVTYGKLAKRPCTLIWDMPASSLYTHHSVKLYAMMV